MVDTDPMFDPERVKDADARFHRFEKLFRVQIRMWDLVNTLLDQETVQLRVGGERRGEEAEGEGEDEAVEPSHSVDPIALGEHLWDLHPDPLPLLMGP